MGLEWVTVLVNFGGVLRLSEYHALYPLRAFLTLFEGLLLFLIVVSEASSADIKRVFPLLAAGLAAVVLYGFVDYFAVDHSAYFRGVNRAQSFYPNPNFLAAYLIALIPLVYIYVGKGVSRAISACLAGAAVSLLALTFSRGGWFAGLFSLALCVFFDRTGSGYSTRAKIVGALLAFVLILQCAGAVIISFDAPVQRFVNDHPELRRLLSPVNLNEPLSDSLSGREGIWAVSAHAFRVNWLTGLGIGRFFHDFNQYYPLPSHPPAWALHQNAHNFFLQMGVELGLIGLVPLLIFFAMLYFQALRSVHTPPGLETDLPREAPAKRGEVWREKLLLLGFLAGLTALLSHSMVEHIFLYPRHMLYLWFLAGAVTVLSRKRDGFRRTGECDPSALLNSGKLLAWGSASLLLAAALKMACSPAAGIGLHDRVKSRAEQIWREEGKPDHREKEHWLQAEEEFFFGISG